MAAQAKKRNGIDAGSSRVLAPARKVAASVIFASWPQADHAKLNVIVAGRSPTRMRNELVTPPSIVELGIVEDRLTIEMADENAVDPAGVDHPQNRHHRLRRLEAAQIDMYGVGRRPRPRPIVRSRATRHACLRCARQWALFDILVPKCLICA